MYLTTPKLEVSEGVQATQVYILCSGIFVMQPRWSTGEVGVARWVMPRDVARL
jgi:hypothetical protein